MAKPDRLGGSPGMGDMWIARLWVLCLGFLVVLTFAGYGTILPKVRRSLVRKVGLLAVLLGAVFGLLTGQLDVYTMLTGDQRPIDNDVFVFLVLLVECIAAIGVLFSLLRRERKASVKLS
jgi:hypothetical protein